MLTKRQKITISSLILAASIFLLPAVVGSSRFYVLAVIVVASYFLSVWSIYSVFAPSDLVNLFVLPVLLTTSFGMYLTQFQVTFGTRVVLALVYVVVMYTILLSENIFNVSIERNIPLVRAARTVGYLATLFVSFAFFTLCFGLGLNGFLFSLIAGLVASLLLAQGLWQIELKETNLKNLLFFSLIGGLMVAEISLALTFWPLDPPKIGLAAAAAIYVVLGIIQHHLRESLDKRTLFEYTFVGAAVFFLLVVSTSWGI